jgi:hypothetical protein
MNRLRAVLSSATGQACPVATAPGELGETGYEGISPVCHAASNRFLVNLRASGLVCVKAGRVKRKPGLGANRASDSQQNQSAKTEVLLQIFLHIHHLVTVLQHTAVVVAVLTAV